MPELDIEQVVSGASAVVDSISLDWLTPVAVIRVLLCIAVCCAVGKLLMRLTDKVLARSPLEHALAHFLHSVIRVLLWSLSAIIVLGAMNINVSSLVALLSIAALAVSLALQNTLENLVGGVQLLTAKPFVSGDLVEIGGHIGTVQDVDLIYTTLITIDRRVVFIPNSTVSTERIVNYNGTDKRQLNVTIGLSYAASPARVRAAVEHILEGDSRIHQDPPYFVHVSGYQTSRVEYTIRAWCDTKDYWDVYFDLMDRLKPELEAAGVHMTYDHVNVHMAAGQEKAAPPRVPS